MPTKKIEVIAITLVVMSVVFIIGLYVNSTVRPIALNALPYTTTTTTNETITVLNDTPATYSLANAGEDEWQVNNQLSCGAIFGNDSILLGTANYTCNNSGVYTVAPPLSNETSWYVTYSYGLDTDTHTAIREVNTTYLSSMNLAVIVLIVLAASGVLATVYILGKRG